MNPSQCSIQKFVEGTCLAAHDHLPIWGMAYSETNGLWATATHNEIAFIQWKPTACECPCNEAVSIPSYTEPAGFSFCVNPEDRIVAKKTSVIYEEEKPVCVASLAWIRGGTQLLVSFLNHHAEYV